MAASASAAGSTATAVAPATSTFPRLLAGLAAVVFAPVGITLAGAAAIGAAACGMRPVAIVVQRIGDKVGVIVPRWP